MGAFFTNVQVFRGDAPLEEIQERVHTAVRQWVCSGSFREAAAHEVADRTVLIATSAQKKWIAVFDEATETQDQTILASLSQILSQTIGAPAVSVLVHDSGVLDLRLYRDGDLVDTYLNRPDYFEPISAKDRKKYLGKPDLWREVLADQATPKILRSVWKETPRFAEDTLRKTADLLEFDKDFCLTGYRYLAQDTESKGLTRLAFRYVPAEATGEAQTVLPKLSFLAFYPEYDRTPGQELQLSLTVNNEGSSSQGLIVVAWGEAVDQNLVELESVQAVQLKDRDAQTRRHRFQMSAPAMFQSGQNQGINLKWAEIKEFEIPGSQPGRQWRAHPLEGAFGINLKGSATKTGEGTLNLGVTPATNREAGQTSQSIHLRIKELPQRLALRPSAGLALPPFVQAQIRKLEQPTKLVALISLDASRESCAVLAAEAMEHWFQSIAKYLPNGLQVDYVAAANERVQKLKLNLREIPAHRKWNQIKHLLLSGEVVSTTPFAPDACDMSSGGVFDARSLFFQVLDDQVSPHLGLWVDVSRSLPAEIEAFKNDLKNQIRKIFEQQAGIQAFMAQWDWVPYFSAQPTLSEQIWGIPGQITTGKNWCCRYLRGISGDLWLGPDLLEHVTDLSTVSPVAEITPVGSGVHLGLNPTATLPELEKSLAILLPTFEDWTTWMRTRRVAHKP